MKWYNKENMARYKFDVSYSPVKDDREDKMIHLLAAWTPKIAITFSREYAASGTLDLNDLVGFANLHMVNAVRNFDWEREIKVPGVKDAYVKIKDINPKEHAAVIWKYVKKSVTLKLRNEITRFKDPMKTTWNNGEKAPNAPMDDFLTQLFPDFFNEEFTGIIDVIDTSSWEIEQLAIGLEVLMDEVLSFKEKDVLKSFYGIDCDKMSQIVLADYYKTSPKYIQLLVHRTINKLKAFEGKKEIIENYYTI